MASDDEGDVIPWNTTTDSVFLQDKRGPRIASAVTCVGSMVGSLLIILSYCLFKELRNQTRLILVHLSCMDFAVALANFVGIIVYFDGYYTGSCDPSGAVKVSCVVQAAVALFATISSVLWTLAVASYLFLRIVVLVAAETKFFRAVLVSFYVINYGVPLVLIVWLLVADRLGYSPYNSSGWCTLITIDPKTGQRNLLTLIFGYDLWIFLSLFLVPILYILIKIRTRQQYSLIKGTISENYYKKISRSADFKFTAIPLVFLFLRIWSVIGSIMYTYANVNTMSLPEWINSTFLYLSGVGDSGQGLANGILFVIFTHKARQIILDRCRCRTPAHSTNYSSHAHTINDDQDTTPDELSPLNSSRVSSSASHRYQSRVT